jgi:hypothetical protein
MSAPKLSQAELMILGHVAVNDPAMIFWPIDARTVMGQALQSLAERGLITFEEALPGESLSFGIARMRVRTSAAPTPSEAARPEVQALMEALKPFADAVFNDNGDVTIDSSRISRRDYMRARAALAAFGEGE